MAIVYTGSLGWVGLILAGGITFLGRKALYAALTASCCNFIWLPILAITITYLVYRALDYAYRVEYPTVSDGVVVVTGASSGIGRDAAFAIAQAGFNVIPTVRKEADVETVLKAAKEVSEQIVGRIHPMLLDVSDSKTFDARVEEIKKKVSTLKGGLAGVVNNAGIAFAGAVETYPLDKARMVFDVNVFGLMQVTQAFLPMLRQSRGRIINVGSIAGRNSNSFNGIYAASKYAVEALSDAMRRELAPWRLSVSVIEPGAIKTPIWDKNNAPAATGDFKTLYPVLLKLEEAAQTRASKAVSTDFTNAAINHALTSPFPQERYLVGNDALFISWIARLPACISDKVLMFLMKKMYNLTIEAPKNK